MNEYVSVEGIKNISNVLVNRKNELKELYELELLPLLMECKSMYGINPAIYDTMYSKIIYKIETLSNLLEGSISHDYEEMVEGVKSLFNNDFNNKFNDLIGNKTVE